MAFNGTNFFSSVFGQSSKESPPTDKDGHGSEETGLLSLLKRNIGKDLSTVSFPVTFNEPLSMLQRLAEELEYCDVLDKAAVTSDPVERIALVAAFAVSGYACTRYRSAKKPFNPMLGETFEDVRTGFIGEKVSHHPPIMACHAQGKGWVWWATSAAKNRFTGKSLEILPVGLTHVLIGDDHYCWEKPPSYVRNLVAGKKYLEHIGLLIIDNTRTKARCELDFKETNFWNSQTPNVVIGTIISPSERVLARIQGTWDGSLVLYSSSSPPRTVWTVHPYPPSPRQHFGFTHFARTLNLITPSISHKIAPTDSRLRPDQRALEEGSTEMAEREKVRLEEQQRKRRKEGKDRRVKWFRKVTMEGAGEDEETQWVYKGGYWEEREKGWIDDGQESLW